MKKLFENIGKYDPDTDCLFPVYLLYPEIPKYKKIQDEKYFTPLIRRHFYPIDEKKIQTGDMLLFRLPAGFHFGIYNGDGKFFHCCQKHKLRLTQLSGYRKFLKGCYRWYSQ